MKGIWKKKWNKKYIIKMVSAGEKFSSFIKQQICGAFVATEFSNWNLNKNYLWNKITILV
jgi:hypothetical protein